MKKEALNEGLEKLKKEMAILESHISLNYLDGAATKWEDVEKAAAEIRKLFEPQVKK